MSSTNRGGKRTPADNYPTPRWATIRLLERLPELAICRQWLEPCAGEGAIIAAVNEFAEPVEHFVRPEWTAIEIRPEAEDVLSRHVPASNIIFDDYLTVTGLAEPEVVISNPPFRIAYEVIQRSLHFRNAEVIMLLRINFLASVKRHKFMQKYPPDVYVLPNRPDFKAHGKTDSIEYAWYHWPKGRRRRECGRIYVLDETPLEERRTNFDSIVHPLCATGAHSLVLDPADGWVCERAGCGHVADRSAGYR